MKLTKSLFVEFINSPKLARWHANDQTIYQVIQDSTHGAMDGAAIGQAVEGVVLATYEGTIITTVGIEDIQGDWHGVYHALTMQALEDRPSIVYQPSFVLGDIFVKCDILVRNIEWTYDLVEVKAKNWIRKKSKVKPLLDKLISDVSVQSYVLQRVLWEKFSWKCYIAHLDKEYIKCWPINPSLLVLKEEVSQELMTDDQMEMVFKTMREVLSLPEERFNAMYPYDGKGYMTYFGDKPPKDSLWSLTRLNWWKRGELYDQWKILLEDFDTLDIEQLKNKKGEATKASTCMELWQNWPETYDAKAIEEELGQLQYPLYFYDYETINWPIPVIEWTSPWQQVVVQYSLHKVTQDWVITHHESIIQPWDETNEYVLKKMIDDMDGVQWWTFIVWYKGFENTRNTEWWMMFPQYKEQLEWINIRTFDLMEIFSKQLYYHRDFQGSSSIKKVLPVMSDISYDGMAVPNGAVAMDKLMRVATWELEWEELKDTTRNLLDYCKLDTRAMVAIWKQLLTKTS